MTLLIILSTVALYLTPPGDPLIANPLNCITTVLQRVILLIVTVVMDKKYVNIDYTVYIIHCGYIQCIYNIYIQCGKEGLPANLTPQCAGSIHIANITTNVSCKMVVFANIYQDLSLS